jgi:hypothetical protein
MATTLEQSRRSRQVRKPGVAVWHAGAVEIGYRPSANGRADPGEVVWAGGTSRWHAGSGQRGRVPYEDDPTQGKDRPALVLAVEGDDVLVLPMTSKGHDRDATEEAREGRLWMDIGTGSWDRRGRPSEVRLNRTVRIPAAGIRREGANLPPEMFANVVAAWKAVR